MDATAYKEIVDQMLMCGMCFQWFIHNEPIIMCGNCHHSFCARCVMKLGCSAQCGCQQQKVQYISAHHVAVNWSACKQQQCPKCPMCRQKLPEAMIRNKTLERAAEYAHSLIDEDMPKNSPSKFPAPIPHSPGGVKTVHEAQSTLNMIHMKASKLQTVYPAMWQLHQRVQDMCDTMNARYHGKRATLFLRSLQTLQLEYSEKMHKEVDLLKARRRLFDPVLQIGDLKIREVPVRVSENEVFLLSMRSPTSLGIRREICLNTEVHLCGIVYAFIKAKNADGVFVYETKNLRNRHPMLQSIYGIGEYKDASASTVNFVFGRDTNEIVLENFVSQDIIRNLAEDKFLNLDCHFYINEVEEKKVFKQQKKRARVNEEDDEREYCELMREELLSSEPDFFITQE